MNECEKNNSHTFRYDGFSVVEDDFDRLEVVGTCDVCGAPVVLTGGWRNEEAEIEAEAETSAPYFLIDGVAHD